MAKSLFIPKLSQKDKASVIREVSGGSGGNKTEILSVGFSEGKWTEYQYTQAQISAML
ncbi:MAG: hypothetical protein ACPGYY_10985 [Bacteroidia bacterium]